jgi:NAD(P)-dependent dehydrogenase (short-subunit alcohol dehydrogenase family)
MEWRDQVAVVTGGARGIGRATARLLAQRGAVVCVNYAHADAAEALVAGLRPWADGLSRWMAGVPSIMQAMLDEVAPKLKTGVRMLSETVRADAREGDIGMQLGEIAKGNPDVVIGSYPFFDLPHGANTNVVLHARDAQKLAQAKHAVEDMLERVRRAQSNSS